MKQLDSTSYHAHQFNGCFAINYWFCVLIAIATGQATIEVTKGIYRLSGVKYRYFVKKQNIAKSKVICLFSFLMCCKKAAFSLRRSV